MKTARFANLVDECISTYPIYVNSQLDGHYWSVIASHESELESFMQHHDLYSDAHTLSEASHCFPASVGSL